MSTIELNGTRLEYIERGSGEPVVFVHGSLGDLRSWEPQLRAFPEHRVVAYSRRHHHPNPCPDGTEDYSAAVHADDLAGLMSGLDIEAAHIVGSSYGAYTALFLAMRHPGRVRTMVLSEPPVMPLLEHHPAGRALRDTFLADVWGPTGEAMTEGRPHLGIELFVDGLFGDGAFDDLPDDVRGPIMDNACEFRLETTSSDFWTEFTCDDARRISTPTLLLSGARSLEMFVLIVDELERCLPHSHRVHVADSSHDVPGERSDEFNSLVRRFLERH